MRDSIRSVRPADMLRANEASLYDAANIRSLLAGGSSGRHSDLIEMDGLPFHEEASTGPSLAEDAHDMDADGWKADGFQQDYDNPVYVNATPCVELFLTTLVGTYARL